ncbi:hypothetical protein Tco_1091508 [Tanacetum coccineum]|uniref:Uncharacterized protein n=1 Tax=Tanacetum coccineum TaxID=301880 RepID=A0ABQ5I785_9ASTR
MHYHLLIHETEMPKDLLPLRKRRVVLLPVVPGYRSGDGCPGTAIRLEELVIGITDTWNDLVGAIQEIAPTTLKGVNQRVTELATTTAEYLIVESSIARTRGLLSFSRGITCEGSN